MVTIKAKYDVGDTHATVTGNGGLLCASGIAKIAVLIGPVIPLAGGPQAAHHLVLLEDQSGQWVIANDRFCNSAGEPTRPIPTTPEIVWGVQKRTSSSGHDPIAAGWSKDANWFWHGLKWNDAVSPDGKYRFDGREWPKFHGKRSLMAPEPLHSIAAEGPPRAPAGRPGGRAAHVGGSIGSRAARPNAHALNLASTKEPHRPRGIRGGRRFFPERPVRALHCLPNSMVRWRQRACHQHA